MKKAKIIIASLLIAFMSLGIFSSCMGSYSLVKRIHGWNKGLGGKWVNSIVHVLLYIIPVYEVCWVVDFLILNTVEFWTGSNPMAMGPNDTEIQVVKYKTETYKITATQNRFDIVQLTGKDANQTIALIYKPGEKAWYVEKDFTLKKIAQYDGTNPDIITAVGPFGSLTQLDSNN